MTAAERAGSAQVILSSKIWSSRPHNCKSPAYKELKLLWDFTEQD